MADETTKTVIASFGQAIESSASIVVELDRSVHGDETSFDTTAGVYFLVHHDSSAVRIVRVRATDGGDVQRIGQVTRSNTVEATFTDQTMQYTLPHRPNRTPTARWYGRSSILNLSENVVTAPGAPCLGELSYNYAAVQYLHRPPGTVTLDADGEWLTDIVVEYEEVG